MKTLDSDGITDPYGPIGRFLPNLPAGIVKIQNNPGQKPREVLYDPTGVSPELILSLMRKGYRVACSVGNPVDRLLIETLASPPSLEMLNAVMADLSMLRFEGTRFEKHIFEMFTTTCSTCNREVAVDHYVWDSDENSLLTKVYNCACGNGGEFAVDAADIELGKKWQRSDGLYRGGVLQKFNFLTGVPPDDISDALAVYPPRILHGLDWIISRMGDKIEDRQQLNCFRALLLFAVDRCNSLWLVDDEEYRPKQIHKPSRVIEYNLWKAMLEAYRFLAAQQDRFAVTMWPNLPTENGVCIYPGSARRFLPGAHDITITDVVAVSPRPNQAYWTLSAIWSVWFLGSSNDEDFLKVLQRKRYDWTWYTDALTALLKNIKKYVSDRARFTLFATELEPSFITPIIFTLIKTDFAIQQIIPSAGFEVLKIESALKSNNKGRVLPKENSTSSNDLIEIVTAVLAAKQQPISYLALLTEVFSALIKNGSELLVKGDPAQFEKDLQKVLKGPSFVDIENRANVETGLWLLKVDEDSQHRFVGF